MSECYVKQVSFKKFLESIGVSSELNAGSKGRFPQPEFTGRQPGPLTRPVNSGSGNRPLIDIHAYGGRQVPTFTQFNPHHNNTISTSQQQYNIGEQIH